MATRATCNIGILSESQSLDTALEGAVAVLVNALCIAHRLPLRVMVDGDARLARSFDSGHAQALVLASCRDLLAHHSTVSLSTEGLAGMLDLRPRTPCVYRGPGQEGERLGRLSLLLQFSDGLILVDHGSASGSNMLAAIDLLHALAGMIEASAAGRSLPVVIVTRRPEAIEACLAAVLRLGTPDSAFSGQAVRCVGPDEVFRNPRPLATHLASA